MGGKDEKKLALTKKMTNLNLDREPEEVTQPLLPFILAEYRSEVIYADLMAKLLIFDSNL